MYGNVFYTQDTWLAHHGVLGMHWGIRRYQPYSVVPRGSGKSGREVGAAKEHSIREKKAAKRHSDLAKSYKTSAESSRSQVAKRFYEQRANNHAYKSRYHSKMAKHYDQKTQGGYDFVKSATEYLNTPYQRLSGRVTTRGKRMLVDTNFWGLTGATLDGIYLAKKSYNTPERKQIRAIRADRKKAAANAPLLSDDEINTRVARLRKENELKAVTAQNLNTGARAVENILLNAGKETIGISAKKYSVKAVDSTVNRLRRE